jgi:CubicO group peptidase (beta-lactamase class C family)
MEIGQRLAPGTSQQPKSTAGQTNGASDPINGLDLKLKVAEALDRRPSAGLAVVLVRDGSLEWFFGHGVADVESKEPIMEDTVFRIGSITKTFTAIAVMQLYEQGLIDLDAPASDYLRAFRLIPARPSFRPTVRHLLTHTAGIGYWRRLTDLLQPSLGAGVRAGRSGAQSLAEYYRRGLPVEVEPGTKWAYSNHGYAALGQIVEDVSGRPLDHFLRERIFEPLEMDRTDLVRSERVRSRLATGYVLRSRGLRAVADREVPSPGGGGMYSTPADLARYIASLQQMYAGHQGLVLKPETLASMFQPHFQLDPRLPGMGLAFELGEESGHKTVEKTGIVSGFHSAIVLAPEDRIGIVALNNTGGLDGRNATAALAVALVRRRLDLPDQAIRTDIPARPEAWSEICGWYSPDPGPVTNLFTRALMGAGAEVTVRHGHLMLKPLHPVPAIRLGMRLHPDDPGDPWAFRVEMPEYGINFRVVFSHSVEKGQTITRLLTDTFSFQKRPDARNPRRLVDGALLAGATAIAVRQRREQQRLRALIPAHLRSS